ncbi:MAG: type II toxin-antitoxin system VapC family toxin [bacterium]
MEKLKSLKKEGLAMSVISLAELYEGVCYSIDPGTDEKALNDFLADISILGIENETCKLFGKERGRLRKAKRMIGDFDF